MLDFELSKIPEAQSSLLALLAIGVGLSAVTNTTANILNYKAQKKANETNIRLNRENREWNLEMWKKQNEYNLPSAQMRRLQDAGLNPILALDSNFNNTASSIAASSAPHVDPVQFQSLKFDVLSKYMDLKRGDAQVDLMKQQKQSLLVKQFLDVAKEKTENKRLALMDKDLDIKDFVKREKELKNISQNLKNILDGQLLETRVENEKFMNTYLKNRASASKYLPSIRESEEQFNRLFKRRGLGTNSKWYEKGAVLGWDYLEDSDVSRNSGSLNGSGFYKRGF